MSHSRFGPPVRTTILLVIVFFFRVMCGVWYVTSEGHVVTGVAKLIIGFGWGSLGVTETPFRHAKGFLIIPYPVFVFVSFCRVVKVIE